MSPVSTTNQSVEAQRIHRSAAIWYAYLLNGIVTYFFDAQGNLVPFLKTELGLSYRQVSFHSSGLAIGMLAAGLVGDRFLKHLGRQMTNWIGLIGMAAGAALIGLAARVEVSVAGFFFIGFFGGLTPIVSVAILADAPPAWRSQAFAESNVISYLFATTVPLSMGAFLALGIDWRAVLIVGIVATAIVIAGHRSTPLPASSAPHAAQTAPLSPAFWAYWVLMMLGVGIEMSVVIWSPEYLERVVGLTRQSAATTAASFFVAMVLGRWVCSRLVRRVPLRLIYIAALALNLAGFAIYWGIVGPVAAAIGLFVLGLGIAQYYTLNVAFGVGVAGAAADKASSRFMVAVGIAVIVTPAIMGALADDFGLRLAHLVLPAMIALSLGTFILARHLERRMHTIQAAVTPS